MSTILRGVALTGWYGLAAPARTPKPVIERLNVAVNKALPELRERYFNLGTDVAGGTVEEFAAFYQNESVKWGRVVKRSGAKVD